MATFDYDSWRTAEPTEWRERDLHWHAYAWRGDIGRVSDADRRSPHTDVPPFEVRDWLRRPARLISATLRTPEAAVEWLRKEVTGALTPEQLERERSWRSDEDRYARVVPPARRERSRLGPDWRHRTTCH